ncbi:MAG: hypothetical protein WCT52_04815 [Candidatus Micrarchaeia archaeon]
MSVSNGNGAVQVRATGVTPPATRKQLHISKKEAKMMGNKFFNLLADAAEKHGFEAAKNWDGKVFHVKVVIPPELRPAFKNDEDLITITIDPEDLTQTLLELDSSASVTRGTKWADLRKRNFMEGYLSRIMEGVDKAISLMKNIPGKERKQLE